MKTISANTPFQSTSDKIALQLDSTPATLSVSVNGVDFETFGDELTDDVNVIANIPVGLYLKLSVNAKITEK